MVLNSRLNALGVEIPFNSTYISGLRSLLTVPVARVDIPFLLAPSSSYDSSESLYLHMVLTLYFFDTDFRIA